VRPVISNAVTEVVVLNILSAGLQSTSADEVNSQRQSFFIAALQKRIGVACGRLLYGNNAREVTEWCTENKFPRQRLKKTKCPTQRWR